MGTPSIPLARGYQARDYPLEQNPPQAIHGTVEWCGSLTETMEADYKQISAPQSYDSNKSTYVPAWARSEYVIDDLSIVGQLRISGFRCEQQRAVSLAWWNTDLPPLGHGETLSLKNKVTIMRNGTALTYGSTNLNTQPEHASPINMQEIRESTYRNVLADFVGWGYTAEEAAMALSQLMDFVPDQKRIGDSSDGIAPCGYEEL